MPPLGRLSHRLAFGASQTAPHPRTSPISPPAHGRRLNHKNFLSSHTAVGCGKQNSIEEIPKTFCPINAARLWTKRKVKKPAPPQGNRPYGIFCRKLQANSVRISRKFAEIHNGFFHLHLFQKLHQTVEVRNSVLGNFYFKVGF